MQRILQDFMKKIILGTSDAWSTSRLSHQPSKLAHHIVYQQIFEKPLDHCVTVNDKQKTLLKEEQICNSVMCPTKSDYEYSTRLVRTLFLMSRQPLSIHFLWLYFLYNNFILSKYLEGIIPDSFLHKYLQISYISQVHTMNIE